MRFRHKKQLKGLLKGGTRVTAWDRHRLLYVRVPKCGNSSIRRSIKGGEKRRMSKSQLVRVRKDWTTFSFVRNPWDRLLSAYRQKASDSGNSSRILDGVYQGFLDHGIPVRANMEFAEFCELICDFPDEKTDKHLCSQTSFLFLKDTPIVSFIGKIENMNEDWDRLMAQIGINSQIGHINRTQNDSQHYSQFYPDTALVNLVGDRYAEDIRHFGYDFGRY
jgi:hypothetical protein